MTTMQIHHTTHTGNEQGNGHGPLKSTGQHSYFFRLNMATEGFLEFDMRQGHFSDKQQGYDLNLTGDIYS